MSHVEKTRAASATHHQGPAAQRAAEEQRSAAAAGAELSPRQLAQRRSLGAAFGPAAQLAEDEELLQGKQLRTAQLAAPEEELLQGRFTSAQRAADEEEMPAQGRFATAQRAGPEEELLQGRFATTAQRAGQEEELLQGKLMSGTVQRAAPEEELLQGRFASTTAVQREAAAPNRTGMPDALKSGIESLSGMDMSEVRVHRNSSQPAQLNALAYAQGNDIHLGPGQEQHLPHEAWHVVQQRQGRVQPTMQLAGTAVNDDVALETEADVMGAKAAQLFSVPGLGTASPAARGQSGTHLDATSVQMKIVPLASLNKPYALGDSKAGDFGGTQASLFYTAKGYPHIHATETLFVESGRGKKKVKNAWITDIHYSDGSKTFWWKDAAGNGNFTPSNGGTPSDVQKTLAEQFVAGWGSIA